MTAALEKSDRLLGDPLLRFTPSSLSKVIHDAPNY